MMHIPEPTWRKIQTTLGMASQVCSAEQAVIQAVEQASTSDEIASLLIVRRQRMHSLQNALNDLATTGE